jgi:hypothetical protein
MVAAKGKTGTDIDVVIQASCKVLDLSSTKVIDRQAAELVGANDRAKRGC